MDFGSVLSLASKNIKKQRPVEKKFKSDFEASKKIKREKDGQPKSEVLRKFLGEKEQERKQKELEEKKRQTEDEKKKVFRIPKKPRPPEENVDTNSKLSAKEKLEKAKKLAASFGKKPGSSGDADSKSRKPSADVRSEKSSSKNNNSIKSSYSDVKKSVVDKRLVEKEKEPSKPVEKKPSYIEKLEKISDEQKLAIIKKLSESLGRKGDKMTDAEKLDKIRKISETIGKGPPDKDKKEKTNGSKHCPLTGKVDRDKYAGSIESLQKMKKDLKEAEEKVLGKTITMLGKTDEGIKREVKHFDRTDAEKMRQALQDKAARIKAMMNRPEEEPPKTRERKKKKDDSDDKVRKSDDTEVSEKRKSSSYSSDVRHRDKYLDDRTSERSVKEEKPKKRPPPPPTMNFNDLLKVAEQKSQEPVKIEPVKKKPVEEERLMTKKQMRSQKELQDYLEYKKQQRELEKQQRQNSDLRSQKEYQEFLEYKKQQLEKQQRQNSDVKREKVNSIPNKSKSTSNLTSKPTNSSQSALKKNLYMEMSKSSSSKSSTAVASSSKINSNTMGKKYVSSSSIPSKPLTKNFKMSSKTGDREHSSSSSKSNDIRRKSSGAKSNNYDNVGENVLVCGPQRNEKPVSSNPFDRIYGEIKKSHPSRPAKRKHPDEYSESEDELDQDMEGFVVDYLSSGEEEDMEEYNDDYDDYSKHIRNIFGYDKRKFKYESDYDIANMEANFKDVMKEEARSARLGLQEDLEDMRLEEEEKKRKKKMKR